MPNKKFNLTFDIDANLRPIKQAMTDFESVLNKLAIPKSFQDGIDKTFSKLNEEIKNFEAISTKGFQNLEDISKADKSFDKILKYLNELKIEGAKISGIEPEKFLPKESLDRVKNLKKEYAKLLDIITAKKNTSAEIKKQTEELEKQRKKLTEQQTLYDSLAKANKQMGSSKGARTKVLEAEEKRIQEIVARRQDLENIKGGKSSTEYKQLGTELKNLNKSFFDNQNSINSLNAYIEKNKAKMASYSVVIGATEKTINELENSIKLLEQAAENPAELDSLREKLKEIKGVSLEEIPTDLEKIKEIIENLNDEELKQINEALINIKNSSEVVPASAEKAADGLEKISEEGRRLTDTAQQVENLRNQIVDFFSIGNAVMLFKRAINSAYETVKELDEVMTQTAVVTDFTVGDMWSQLPEYTKRANELGVAVKGAYESATLYYQQGLNTNEVVAVSSETLKMARIAGMDYAEATNYMTAALRGFNMEINETNAQRINDVYSELAAITASDTQEIATAMTKTASIASNAGMEFETTAAFLSQIIETTREAPETAGTALKTVIARFQELKKDPLEIGEVDGEAVDANKIETALRTIDVALRDTNGQFRDLDSVFLEIAQKWNTLDTNTQRYIATMAAGSRQQSRFIAMMSDYTRTMELVNAANNSVGASQQQFEKTLDSLESKLAKLDNAWNEFTMGLANSVAIKGTISLITLLINAINNLTDILPAGIDSFAKLGIAWGALRGAGKVFDSVFLNMKQDMGPVDAITKSLASNFKVLGKNIGTIFTKGFWSTTPISKYTKALNTLKSSHNSLNFAQNALNTQIAEQQAIINSKIKTDLEKAAAQKQLTTLEIAQKSVLDQLTASYKNLNFSEQESLILTKAKLSQEQLLILLTNETARTNFFKALSEKELTEETLKATAAEHLNIDAQKIGILTRLKYYAQILFTSKAKSGEAAANLMAATTQNTLTASINKALIALGPYVWAIMAAAVALGVLGKAIYDASPEQQLKKATAATNEAADAAENLKNKYDELKTSLESLSEKETNLENLTKGTAEWKEAVQELNNELINLATNYPELSQFITSEGGVLTLDVEGAEEVLRQIEQNKNLAQDAANSARIIQNQKQARVDFDTLSFDAQLYNNESVGAENFYATSNLAKRIASGDLAPQEVQAEVNRLGFANVIDEEVIKELKEFGNSLLVAENQAKVFTSQLVNTGLEFNNIPAEVVSGGEEYLRIATEGLLDEAKAEVGSIDNTERKEYAEMMGYTTGGLFGKKFFDAEGNEVKDITDEVIKAALANKKVVEGEAFKASAQVIQKAISGSYGDTTSRLVTDGSGALTGRDLGTAQTWSEFVANNGLTDFLTEVGPEVAAEMEKNFSNIKEEFTKVFSSEDGTRGLKSFGFTQGEDFQDVGITTLKGFLDNLQTAMMGSGVEEATQLGQAIKEEYSKLSPELGEQFLGAINALDWENIDSIEGFSDVLSELGIDVESAGIDVEALEDRIKEVAKATRELSFENLKEELKGLEDLADDIKDRESTAREFTEEQMNSLIKAGANRDDFIMSGIDEYTYIGDSLISLLDIISGHTSSILQEIIGNTQDKIARGEVYADAAKTSYGRDITDVIATNGTVYKGLSNLDVLEYLINGRLSIESFTDEELQELAKVFMPDFDFRSFGNQEIVDKLKEEYNEVYGSGGTILNQNYARYNDEKQKELELSYSKLGSGQAILDKGTLSSEESDAKEKALDSLILKEKGLSTAVESLNGSLKEQSSIFKNNSKVQKAHIIDLNQQRQSIKKLAEVLDEDTIKVIQEGLASGQTNSIAYNEALEPILKQAQAIFGEGLSKELVEEHFSDFIKIAQGGKSGLNAYKSLGKKLGSTLVTGFLGEYKKELGDDIPDVTAKIMEKISEIQTDLSITGTTDVDLSQLFEDLGLAQNEALTLISIMEAIGGFQLTGNLGHWESKTHTKSQGGSAVAFSEETRKELESQGWTNWEFVWNTSLLGSSLTEEEFPEITSPGDSTSEWKNPYDKQYVLLEKINELLRDRETLEQNYQRLVKTGLVNIDNTLEHYNKLYDNLEKEKEYQNQLVKNRKQELKDLYNSDVSMQKYATYNESEGIIDLKWGLINSISPSNTELGEKVENWVSEVERITESIEEASDKELELLNEQIDIQEQLQDSYLSFEERIATALETQAQNVIDNQQEEFDALTDAENELADAISKSIDEIRQARENEKTEDEIAEKERRLAYLRQDTTGSNALEIKRLEEEIAEQREEYQDALVDQALTNLQEQNEAAAEQRQRQIELMQSQLEYNIENGVYTKKAAEMIESVTNDDNFNVKDNDILDLLSDAERWGAMSSDGLKKTLHEFYNELSEAAAHKDKDNKFNQTELDVNTDYSSLMFEEWRSNGGVLTSQIEHWNDLRNQKIESDEYTGSITKTISKSELENWLESKTGIKANSGNLEKDNKTQDNNYIVHTIKSGETLSSIAAKYGTTVSQLMKDNSEIKDKNKIYAGKTLKVLKKYKTGGIADFTGPAWLDGSKSKPELILNARDTENFIMLKDILSGVLNNASNIKSKSGDNYFDIDIQVDEIANDYDVDQMAERIKQNIYEDSTYRNVNAINLLR